MPGSHTGDWAGGRRGHTDMMMGVEREIMGIRREWRWEMREEERNNGKREEKKGGKQNKERKKKRR